MIAGGSDDLDTALLGYLLDQFDVPSQVEGAHFEHGPYARGVGFFEGGDRLLLEGGAVDDFRVGVPQTSCVGSNMFVA